MEQLRTLAQHKRLFFLLDELGWIERRAVLVVQFSDGRTKSSKDLYYRECAELIDFLQHEYNKSKNEFECTKYEQMQRKFFYYCHELGWKKEGKLDYNRINNWLRKFSYLKKLLSEYTEDEMPKLLQQIEKVLENTKK